jgi:hypothetical protein
LEAGRLLIEAKAALPHGSFLYMVDSELPFKRSTAFRLMTIAADPRLTNGAHVQHLPPHWGTLYELTKLTDEQFEARLATGGIHPEMERRDVVVAAIRERRAEREVELGAFQAALPDRRYGVIYADPPWRWEAWRDGASDYPLSPPQALRMTRLRTDDARRLTLRSALRPGNRQYGGHHHAGGPMVERLPNYILRQQRDAKRQNNTVVLVPSYRGRAPTRLQEEPPCVSRRRPHRALRRCGLEPIRKAQPACRQAAGAPLLESALLPALTPRGLIHPWSRSCRRDRPC